MVSPKPQQQAVESALMELFTIVEVEQPTVETIASTVDEKLPETVLEYFQVDSVK